MGKVIPLAESKARFEALQKRFAAVTPKTFKGYMGQLLIAVRAELIQTVYSSSKPGMRSGQLKAQEMLRWQGDTTAIITNRATSVWKGVTSFYAWFVARGVKARDKGRKYYAWMVDPRAPRPTTWEEWVAARDAGKAVLAHRLKAVKPRDWRKTSIQKARQQGMMVKELRTNNKAAHDG